MATAVVVVALVAAGTVVALTSGHRGLTPAAATEVKTLAVRTTWPLAGTAAVPTDSVLTVSFDRPLAAGSPTPVLSPPVPGSWVQSGSSQFDFAATDGLEPGVAETVTVPGGADGVVALDGARLANAFTWSFTAAPMSTLRTQQLLAQLAYLPLTFAPAGPAPAPNQMADDEPGSFTWKWSPPASLASLWSEGVASVMTRGAVMSFEGQHGLATDGDAGPQVWSALLADAAAGKTDPYGHYDWVDVSTTVPESTTVWRDGQVAYVTPANTGIEAAQTAVGTWPVYVRYTSTTMSGTNPDGSHYDDPGVPWVSYFHGGDALHGFVRASYGTPQSLGCVEMPPANAALVYPLTPIGTLVTIEPPGAHPATAPPPTTTTSTTTTTAPATTTTS